MKSRHILKCSLLNLFLVARITPSSRRARYESASEELKIPPVNFGYDTLALCALILVTLFKMRPHYSHPGRENATPSSGTSPLASCKGVPLGSRRSNTVFVLSLTYSTGSKVAIVTKCVFCLYSQAQKLSEAFSRLLLLASSFLCKLDF